MTTSSKYTRADVFRGGPGLDGYAWRADVWCESCVKEAFKEEGPFDEQEFKDSDRVPQPIFFGEHDVPQHCCKCNKYLYGGRRPKLRKPALDPYDLVIVVKGGLVQHVAAPAGGAPKVLLVDLDVLDGGNSPAFEEYDSKSVEEARGLVRELADQVSSLPGADLQYVEWELEVDDPDESEEEEEGDTA